MAPISMASEAPDRFPQWAYPGCPAASAPAIPDRADALFVPGSKIHFTGAEIRDRSSTPDWFPEEHSPLPPIIAASRSRGKIACGYCHLANGTGRPENARVAGLAMPYIIAQVKALQAHERQAATPDWGPTSFMVDSTEDLSDQEIAAAAEYFSRQSVKSFVRVVEAAEVPKHKLACFMFVPVAGNPEPITSSIIEMPTNVELFERRDPHAEYVAYVPKGSIARGRLLATTGGSGLTVPCATCHGSDLKGGAGQAGPPLAGRFPGYLFRQLYGFQSGARRAVGQPMQAVVARLQQRDMIDLAAYAASLEP